MCKKPKQEHLRSKPDLTKVATRVVDIYASAASGLCALVGVLACMGATQSNTYTHTLAPTYMHRVRFHSTHEHLWPIAKSDQS